MPRRDHYCTHELNGKRDCSVIGQYYLCKVDGNSVPGALKNRMCVKHQLPGQVCGPNLRAEFLRNQSLQQNGMPIPKKRNRLNSKPVSTQEQNKESLRCTFVYNDGRGRCKVNGNYYRVLADGSAYNSSACKNRRCKKHAMPGQECAANVGRVYRKRKVP